jgi:hypothetical protein
MYAEPVDESSSSARREAAVADGKALRGLVVPMNPSTPWHSAIPAYARA